MLDLKNMVVKLNKKVMHKVHKIKDLDLPVFHTHKVDFKKIKKVVKKYKKYKNIIVIGNGGSITSFFAYYKALSTSDKNVEVLATMEPDLIAKIRKKYSKKNTLVIPISKSGNTVGVLEDVIALKDYPMLIITSDNDGALNQYAKLMKIDTIVHPIIGGRFIGTSEPAYIPAALLGINVEKIDKGARAFYRKCSPKVSVEKNPALELSTLLYALDLQGYSEVFLPIYSTKLDGFITLIMQLIHESSGKKRKGQTIVGAFAPESQHHTNQRFFGGKKNMIGLFVSVDNYDNEIRLSVPKKIQSIKLRDNTLKMLDKQKLSKSLFAEYFGTMKDAKDNKIPNATIHLKKVDETEVGKFMALWHYVAVYSSVLRDVNPYDQPQVESSKEISFKLRE